VSANKAATSLPKYVIRSSLKKDNTSKSDEGHITTCNTTSIFHHHHHFYHYHYHHHHHSSLLIDLCISHLHKQLVILALQTVYPSAQLLRLQVVLSLAELPRSAAWQLREREHHLETEELRKWVDRLQCENHELLVYLRDAPAICMSSKITKSQAIITMK